MGNCLMKCSICKQELADPVFARNYPNFVCRTCDARAVNVNGDKPNHISWADDGDNPVFIDGIRCWRLYKFGGFVTMRDEGSWNDIWLSKSST